MRKEHGAESGDCDCERAASGNQGTGHLNLCLHWHTANFHWRKHQLTGTYLKQTRTRNLALQLAGPASPACLPPFSGTLLRETHFKRKRQVRKQKTRRKFIRPARNHPRNRHGVDWKINARNLYPFVLSCLCLLIPHTKSGRLSMEPKGILQGGQSAELAHGD